MKRLLCLCAACALLLVGCSSVGDALQTTPLPDASIPTWVESSREPAVSKPPQIDPTALRFSEMQESRLTRIDPPESDLTLWGLACGEDTYFCLYRREREQFLFAYGTDGKRKFGGSLGADPGDWEMMGFAQGNVCLYSRSSGKTYACDTKGHYLWFAREQAQEVRLTEEGFLLITAEKATLYPPNAQAELASYALSQGETLIGATASQAILQTEDGVRTLSAGGMLSAPLPQDVTGFAGGYRVGREGLSACVWFHQGSGLALPWKNGRALACGDDFLLLCDGEEGTWLSLTSRTSETLSLADSASFCGRIGDGFAFYENGVYYRFLPEGPTPLAVCKPYRERDLLLGIAGEALCAVSAREFGVSLAYSGAPLSLSPEVTGFYATPAQGERLYNAVCAVAEATAEGLSLPERFATVYLCETVQKNGNDVPYLSYAEGGKEALLLNVSDSKRLARSLEELFAVKG